MRNSFYLYLLFFATLLVVSCQKDDNATNTDDGIADTANTGDSDSTGGDGDTDNGDGTTDNSGTTGGVNDDDIGSDDGDIGDDDIGTTEDGNTDETDYTVTIDNFTEADLVGTWKITEYRAETIFTDTTVPNAVGQYNFELLKCDVFMVLKDDKTYESSNEPECEFELYRVDLEGNETTSTAPYNPNGNTGSGLWDAEGVYLNFSDENEPEITSENNYVIKFTEVSSTVLRGEIFLNFDLYNPTQTTQYLLNVIELTRQ